MKHLLSLVLCVAAFAQPRIGPQIYWPYAIDDTSSSTQTLSTAATWGAIGFFATANRTLSSIEIPILSVVGTLTSGDLRVSLYSNATGFRPGTEIEGINSAGVPVTGWNTLSGFTASVTAGTAYWIVFRNMDASPASNHFLVQRRTLGASAFGNSTSTAGMNQWASASSTDSGSTWTRGATITPGIVNWADGTKEGFPITNTSNCQIYQARECGMVFTVPGIAPRVTGIAAMVTRTSNPTGSLRLRLWEGSGASRTLIATATGSGVDVGTTPAYTSFFFASTITLNPWRSYTVSVGETANSDASSIRYNLTAYQIKSDATSLFSGMFAGSVSSTLTTDGSTWSDTANEQPHITFFLDMARPFAIPNGGFSIQ